MYFRFFRKRYSLPFILIFLTAAAFYFNLKAPRPEPWTITKLFNHPLQFAEPDPHSVSLLANNQATFPLSTASATAIKVQFFFTCPQECGMVTVRLPTGKNQPALDLTVFDPLLPPPGYFTLTTNSLTLFEKRPLYRSLESFLHDPPSSLIATEPYTARFIPYASTIALNRLTRYSLPDYILTTYQVPRLFGRYFEFNRTISLNGLALENGYLDLTVMHLDSGPLYLTNPEIIP